MGTETVISSAKVQNAACCLRLRLHFNFCAFTSRSAYKVLSHGSSKDQHTSKTALRTGGLLCPAVWVIPAIRRSCTSSFIVSAPDMLCLLARDLLRTGHYLFVLLSDPVGGSVIRTNGRVGGSWAKDNRRQDRRLRSRTKDAARIGLLGVSVAGHCRPLIILALQLCLRLLSRLSRI
ncbi:hypothetical protein C4D60_Mb02t04760 [Musa balbisiana]|uniref:Uncharacterized protein n=1 Tax=Musa balbisiana TaxID=52838 RepID=A0A4S8I891_MUSBA|nr:hypothetical protein C4D60_Mb02t04760 [Musa balbisiana]